MQELHQFAWILFALVFSGALSSIIVAFIVLLREGMSDRHSTIASTIAPPSPFRIQKD